MSASTVVLLHGSLLGPWCWERLTPELTAHGHRVRAPTLPYGDGRSRSAAHVESIAEQVGAVESPVFVAHSLAGLLTPALAARFPSARIVYLAALLPSPGESLLDQFDDEPEIYEPQWARWGAPPVWEDADRARRFLFHDADEATAAKAFARLKADSPTLALESAPDDWPSLPAAAICPSGDRTISPEWMRRATRERLGVEPLDLDAGHCPQIGRPRQLAELLLPLLACPPRDSALARA